MENKTENERININEKVENFELEAYHNDEIKNIKLSDSNGKWRVLVFYPADFTFICPTELKELADNYDEFLKENVELMSVSTDTTFVHNAWHDNSKSIATIKYPMLADPTGKVCKQFGTYIAKEGLSLRGTFIINPEGVLKFFEMNDNSIGRSTAELLRKIKAAKFVEENGGEVCPASWKPGDKTIKPCLDLVGKI